MNLLNDPINWINQTRRKSGLGAIGVLLLTVIVFDVGLLALTFFSPVLIVILVVIAVVYFLVWKR